MDLIMKVALLRKVMFQPARYFKIESLNLAINVN